MASDPVITDADMISGVPLLDQWRLLAAGGHSAGDEWAVRRLRELIAFAVAEREALIVAWLVEKLREDAPPFGLVEEHGARWAVQHIIDALRDTDHLGDKARG